MVTARWCSWRALRLNQTRAQPRTITIGIQQARSSSHSLGRQAGNDDDVSDVGSVRRRHGHSILPQRSSRPLGPPKPQQSLVDALYFAGPESSKVIDNARLRNSLPADWPGEEQFFEMVEERRGILLQIEQVRAEAKQFRETSNSIRKRISASEKAGNQHESEAEKARFEHVNVQVRKTATDIKTLEDRAEAIFDQITKIRLEFPNESHESSPIGPEEKARIEKVYEGVNFNQTLPPAQAHIFQQASDSQQAPLSLEEWDAGVDLLQNRLPDDDKRASLNESVIRSDHLTLSSYLSPGPTLDMDAGRQAVGPSYPFMLGPLAMLESALLRHAVSLAIEKEFLTVSPPVVVKTDIAERCGFKPRKGDGGQTYFVMSSSAWKEKQQQQEKGQVVQDGDDSSPAHCLVGTAEISLGALVSNRTFRHQLRPDGSHTPKESSDLPLRLLAVTPSFRAEDGGRGAETKGLYRLHQFQKAEMFVLTPHDTDISNKMLSELVSLQEDVLQSLGLSYRVLNMPTEELGSSAYQKYDIEAWMPGRGSWGEVSSASNCTDYQSSRLHIKHKYLKEGNKNSTIPVHTLNATLCAVPRLIIALLEQYGIEATKGRLRLPSVLKKHWLGSSEQVEWVDQQHEDSGLTPLDQDVKAKLDQVLKRGKRLHGMSSTRSYHTQAGRQEHTSRNFHTHTRATRQPRLPSSRRNLSTSESAPDPAPKLVQRFKSRLTKLSQETGTDLASLSASFLILHELSAIIPLVLLFYLLGLFGIGEKLCTYFQDEAESSTEETTWKKYIGDYLQEGLFKIERYARRKGWWGYEKGSQDQVSKEGKEGKDLVIAGSLANAVAAYVIVKIIVVPRMFISLWLSPAFARRVFEPVKKRVATIRAKKR
ncbi:unnamed protein product [Sympodiomycopsis kandeliae]